MKLGVLIYPGDDALASTLLPALSAETVEFAMRRFPDRETYLRIDSDVRDRDIALLCTLHDPDARVAPLLFMSDTLRELGARSVGLIAPYLAYMRQDRRFHPGEALTSTSFARVLSNQFDWLVTVDPHLHRRKSLSEIYRVPTAVVHAAPLLTDWIREHVEKPFVIGPDGESEQWVRVVADAVPCPYVVLEKTRRGDRDVSVSRIPSLERWLDRTPVLIDDIISSAHTMSEAVDQLRAARIAKPVCVGVHGVFAGQAHELLRDAGAAQIVTTNTIPHPSNQIDVSSVLAKPILHLVAEANAHRKVALSGGAMPASA